VKHRQAILPTENRFKRGKLSGKKRSLGDVRAERAEREIRKRLAKVKKGSSKVEERSRKNTCIRGRVKRSGGMVMESKNMEGQRNKRKCKTVEYSQKRPVRSDHGTSRRDGAITIQ